MFSEASVCSQRGQGIGGEGLGIGGDRVSGGIGYRGRDISIPFVSSIIIMLQ